jgi:hypothetical protein
MVPLFTNSENITYCCAGYMSEFPEALKAVPSNNINAGTVEGCRNAICALGQKAPIFMPKDGLNSCSDADATGVYSKSRWMDNLPYQPIDNGEMTQLFNDCNTSVNFEQDNATGTSSNVRAIPKFFANILCFNIHPSLGGLWYGSVWSKAAPSCVINSALLKRGSGDISATFWLSGYDSGNNGGLLPSYWIPFYNLIADGALPILGYPVLYAGNGTFIDKSVQFSPGSGIEQACIGGTSGAQACLNYYFSNLGRAVDDVFSPDVWYKNVQNKSCFGGLNNLRMFDLDSVKMRTIVMKTGSIGDWSSFNLPPQTRKFPFVCGGSQQNFGLFVDKDGNPIVSYITGPLFNSDQGKKVGNELCQALSKMIPRLPSDPERFFAKTSPASCMVPAKL